MHDFTPLESGAPRQITPTTPADHFEVLTRAVFNAGISWQVVQAHWSAIADAFADFDPDTVAGYDEQDVERLVADERLIQSHGKLAAIPDNARTFVRLAGENAGFDTWLRGVGDYDARERALAGSSGTSASSARTGPSTRCAWTSPTTGSGRAPGGARSRCDCATTDRARTTGASHGAR